MANKIHIEIACPDRNFYSGEADMLVVKALDGDMAVMYGHQPYVTPVSIGSFKVVNGSDKKIGAMSNGFLHVDGKKATVIVDSVEWADEIDKDRALASKERAEQRISEKPSGVDLKRANIALKKAKNRIKIADK